MQVNFFQICNHPWVTLLFKKLGDNILNFFKKQKQLPCPEPGSPTIIGEKEMDGLQYLAGYVVMKFMKKKK